MYSIDEVLFYQLCIDRMKARLENILVLIPLLQQAQAQAQPMVGQQQVQAAAPQVE